MTLIYEDIEMIITVSEFNTYSGNMETATDLANMKESLIKTAQEIVSEYLGYSVENCEHEDFISAIGQPELFLFGQPITSVLDLSLNGSAVPASDYTIRGRSLRLKAGVWPVGIDNVYCRYMAGWTNLTVPEEVKTVVKQIASLLLQETNGNIGVTGKSMSENSRTYINYTNFDKWLHKLEPYVVKRLA